MTKPVAVDLFSGGARGWDVHDEELGIETIGVESDDAAVATSKAAGFHTIQADVRKLSPVDVGFVGGKFSPPCQTFSAAGKGAGRLALDTVYGAMDRLHQTGRIDYDVFADVRTGLVLEPLRWALDLVRVRQPFRWMVLEQVPPVLPVWERMAKVLESVGYSVATGNLHAEQYGVPQTRKRAVLIARLGSEARLPVPTHSRYHSRSPERLDPGVKKWVSMAEALGWGLEWRPSPTITGGGTETGGAEPIAKLSRYSSDPGWQRSNYSQGSSNERTAEKRGRTIQPIGHPSVGVTSKGFQWLYERPATTVQGDPRLAAPGHRCMTNDCHADRDPESMMAQAVRVTVQEAAVLQSLPADHPWQGSKTKQYLQIGNAIPGLLARAILERVL